MATTSTHSPGGVPARTWTQIGADSVQEFGRDQIERAIAELVWRNATPAVFAQLNVLDQTAIKTLVAGFDLPEVTAVAAGIPLDSRVSMDDSANLFGVRCRYRNGIAELYALDTGTTVIVIASDFTPCAQEPARPRH